MNTTAENKILEMGLKIHLYSFNLPRGLINDNDTIRVSITTLPEQNKQNFEVAFRKIHNCNHDFTVNVTSETKKILFVFRKIDSQLKNPIIASTIIHSNHFPKISQNIYKFLTGTATNHVKNVKIFEPVQKQKETTQKVTNRRQIGEMKVQLFFTSPYPTVIETKTNNNNVSNDLEQVREIKHKQFDVKIKYNKYKNDENVPILNSTE